jgi:hypothetical protein
MQNIQLTEGNISLTINGDKDRVISFNPADENIVTRMQEFMDDAETSKKAFSEIKGKVKLDENGLADLKEVADFQKKMDLYFRDKIDYVFNAKMSDIAFGKTCCFSLNENGEMIAEAFLNALMPYIKSEIEKRQKKNAQRVQKYTSQFKK